MWRVIVEIVLCGLLAWMIWLAISYAASGKLLATLVSLYGFSFLVVVVELVWAVLEEGEGIMG